MSFLLASFSPFIDPLHSFYVKTFGFSFLYISFGIVLIYFLTEDEINNKLNRFFSAYLVNIICVIGYSSYSIYIIHTFVNYIFLWLKDGIIGIQINQILVFILSSTISILLGMLMTNYIEKYFLKIRDKFYPSRIV